MAEADHGSDPNINAAAWWLLEGAPSLNAPATSLELLAQSQTYSKGEWTSSAPPPVAGYGSRTCTRSWAALPNPARSHCSAPESSASADCCDDDCADEPELISTIPGRSASRCSRSSLLNNALAQPLTEGGHHENPDQQTTPRRPNLAQETCSTRAALGHQTDRQSKLRSASWIVCSVAVVELRDFRKHKVPNSTFFPILLRIDGCDSVEISPIAAFRTASWGIMLSNVKNLKITMDREHQVRKVTSVSDVVRNYALAGAHRVVRGEQAQWVRGGCVRRQRCGGEPVFRGTVELPNPTLIQVTLELGSARPCGLIRRTTTTSIRHPPWVPP